MTAALDIDVIIAEMDARDAARAAFLSANHGRSFAGIPRATTGLTRVIVSPSFETGGYRLTRFDTRGPCGHTEFRSYEDAVKSADSDYGVRLADVEFAGAKIVTDRISGGRRWARRGK